MTYKNDEISSIEDEGFVIIQPIQYNRYGWNKDNDDTRDIHFIPSDNIVFNRKFSLRKNMPPVLNQGKLGSCTSSSICNAISFCEIINNKNTYRPKSILFNYYNQREMNGYINEDLGASIRNSIKSINKHGVCFEETWPYDITQFTEKPPPNCYKEARNHKIVKYERISPNINDIKSAIISGFPVIFGFIVFDSIEKPTTTRSGIIPIPSSNSKKLGGHCVLCCGWDDSRRLFEIMNSWGTEWGNNGYGWISYDYIINSKLSSDFWKITLV